MRGGHAPVFMAMHIELGGVILGLVERHHQGSICGWHTSACWCPGKCRRAPCHPASCLRPSAQEEELGPTAGAQGVGRHRADGFHGEGLVQPELSNVVRGATTQSGNRTGTVHLIAWRAPLKAESPPRPKRAGDANIELRGRANRGPSISAHRRRVCWNASPAHDRASEGSNRIWTGNVIRAGSSVDERQRAPTV
jgi:hypothetical protein